MTDELVVDNDLPGSTSHNPLAGSLGALSSSPTGGTRWVAVTEPVASAAPQAPLALIPGKNTSHFKLVRAVCTFLSAGSALFVALSANGAIHPTPEALIVVPAVASAVIGWVTTNYGNARRAIKVAALSNPSPPSNG